MLISVVIVFGENDQAIRDNPAASTYMMGDGMYLSLLYGEYFNFKEMEV